MADQDAADINQMMQPQTEVPKAKGGKSKFIWVVLGCVIFGVGLGVVVYQQSLDSAIKPTVTPRPSVAPLASPTKPEVSEVKAVANTVSFPKAGTVRVYWSGMGGLGATMTFDIGGVKKTVTLPAKTGSDPMSFVDSTIVLTGPTSAKVTSYTSSASTPSVGWINPTSQKCGANGDLLGTSLLDVSARIAWVTGQAGGEPLVSQQCWGDYDPPKNNGTIPPSDFNDYFVILSYVPTTTASPSPSAAASVAPSPSPSASVKASASPSPSIKASASPSPSIKASPSPSVKASASPSPSVKASASPSPSVVALTTSPSPSPRVTMPDTSEGTPVSGIFEVTVGTVSIGLLLLILGLFGLLAL